MKYSKLKDMLITHFGFAVMASHIAGILLIVKYDSLCGRPFTLGVHAFWGIAYCCIMVMWALYFTLFWNE